jgi:hypothetical protein
VDSTVTFTVQSGGGQLAASNLESSPLSTSLAVNADIDGTVQVFYRQPAAPGVASWIKASASTAAITFQTFSGIDSDGDGLTDLRELQLGTNPNLADTDGDGMPDGWEVAHGLNPLVNDANGDRDGDGVTNLQEYLNWKALHSGPGLPTGFQLVLRCSDNQYFGVRTATWEILPVVGP